MYKLPLLFIFLVTAFSAGEVRPEKVLKLGHGLDVSHPVHKAMVFMGKEIAEKSQGRIRLDIYPSQQLGTERETLELLQIGSLDLTKVSSSVVEGFAPLYKVFSVPFLFKDDSSRFQILDGEIGKSILESATSIRLKGLTYYDAGTRSFYTKEFPILEPRDLDGLKIRVQESPAAIDLVNNLGGSATPISWGELYTSLQQGVVDGAENNPPSFYLSKHYEVAKYYSLNEHTAVPDILFMSLYTWNRLTTEEQKIVQDAAEASAIYQRTLWAESTQEALENVQKEGVTVIRPDKKPFIEKLAPMYEQYYQESAEMEQIIRSIIDIQQVEVDTMEVGSSQ